MVGSQLDSCSFEAQRGAPWNRTGLLSWVLAVASAQGYSSERLSSPVSAERRADEKFPGDNNFGLEFSTCTQIRTAV